MTRPLPPPGVCDDRRRTGNASAIQPPCLGSCRAPGGGIRVVMTPGQRQTPVPIRCMSDDSSHGCPLKTSYERAFIVNDTVSYIRDERLTTLRNTHDQHCDDTSAAARATAEHWFAHVATHRPRRFSGPIRRVSTPIKRAGCRDRAVADETRLESGRGRRNGSTINEDLAWSSHLSRPIWPRRRASWSNFRVRRRLRAVEAECGFRLTGPPATQTRGRGGG